MSRIGKQPVVLPAGVTAELTESMVRVKGPKGLLSQAVPTGIQVKQIEDALHVSRSDDERQSRANHGLVRALVANMVRGVKDGFEKKLSIQGVGYKAEAKGRELVLTLGYSHPIVYAVPTGVDVTVDKAGTIIVHGIDRQQVGQVASEIRAFRSPDSYKGKGIRYAGEFIKIKAGKSATK